MNEKPKNPTEQVVGTVEVKKIGNSSGFLLPKDFMSRLGISAGDEFFITMTPEGGMRFTPRDPHFEKAMEIARRGMKRYRNALAELAK